MSKIYFYWKDGKKDIIDLHPLAKEIGEEHFLNDIKNLSRYSDRDIFEWDASTNEWLCIGQPDEKSAAIVFDFIEANDQKPDNAPTVKQDQFHFTDEVIDSLIVTLVTVVELLVLTELKNDCDLAKVQPQLKSLAIDLSQDHWNKKSVNLLIDIEYQTLYVNGYRLHYGAFRDMFDDVMEDIGGTCNTNLVDALIKQESITTIMLSFTPDRQLTFTVNWEIEGDEDSYRCFTLSTVVA